MKRRITVTIVMIITMLALAIPLAMPAFASQVTATKDVSPSSPNIYYVGDTIHYVMSVTNPIGNVGVINTLDDIHDHLPDGTIYYFVEPGVDPPLVQNPGDSANFTLDYIIDVADLVTLPNGSIGVINTFHATGTDSNGDLVNAEVQKNSRVISPSTITGISASAASVVSGDNVTLTVTEENDGDDPLTGPQVVVNDGTSDIATLTAPPDSGDTNTDGVLDPGETWSWSFSYGPLTTATTFTATGSGTDSLGNTVTYPGDPDEQDAVTVDVQGNQGCTPGFWKNNARNWDAVAWVGYSPDDLFSDVFGVAPFTIRGNGKSTIDDPTLLQALDANGSGINLLARSAVAALLNASNPNISYAMSVAEVISAVQNAIASGADAIQALGEQLDYYNNAGCSINQQGEPIIPEMD
jgi:hypothetical protein